MTTAISVIIPTYNGAHHILKTIESILSQTYSPQEIIVIDDGSPDDTQELVANIHPKVRYHRTSNSGICKARNAGALLASSPYIAFCDHDDLWRPDKLAKQMSLHEGFPNLQYSFTNFSIVSDEQWTSKSKFDEAPKDFFAGFTQVNDASLVSESSLYDRLLRFQPIFPSTVLMKKSFFQELGGFNESFGRNPAEDLEFTLRCVQHTQVGVVREPVVGIRKHSTNFSGNSYSNARGRLEILEYVLRYHSISKSTKSILEEQITLGRVNASHSAFAAGNFAACKDLLSGVPAQYLTPKTKIKLAISECPVLVAKFVHRLLIHTA